MTKEELDDLKASLLHRLRPEVPLGPEEGDAAFDQHVLLAVRIHRAARLCQTVRGEGNGWNQFFEEFFPSDRNGRSDASLLWKRWRYGLLKDLTPLDGVGITHSHPEQHWKLCSQAALCIDLESMWDDFEYAVDQFISALEADDDRAQIALARWRVRTWTVRPFQLLPQRLVAAGGSQTIGFLHVGSVTASTPSTPEGLGKPRELPADRGARARGG